MPHKRSPEGEVKQKTQKSLKTQTKKYIDENSYRDYRNGETSNLLSPEQVREYLLTVNLRYQPSLKIKIVRPEMYGSLVAVANAERFLGQAAAGLVLEGTVKY
jgi:hypothetical protein